ncbi:hypothetical protein HMPREF1555_00461 [Porphyromonas gingivalis F0570]|uniref:Uncharacterized protein n=1 Tax=Porphyromonas gingivalis F0570 TaxID=1227271 RepID=A0A0E2LSC0_PORGN|nr:hypothetical protein HMPREF1555_00461 [Porphyromonas gingivalis F0570]
MAGFVFLPLPPHTHAIRPKHGLHKKILLHCCVDMKRIFLSDFLLFNYIYR